MVGVEMREVAKSAIDGGLGACRNHIRKRRDHRAIHGLGPQAPTDQDQMKRLNKCSSMMMPAICWCGLDAIKTPPSRNEGVASSGWDSGVGALPGRADGASLTPSRLTRNLSVSGVRTTTEA